MSDCKGKVRGFSSLKRCALQVNFGGGEVSSDGGLPRISEQREQ